MLYFWELFYSLLYLVDCFYWHRVLIGSPYPSAPWWHISLFSCCHFSHWEVWCCSESWSFRCEFFSNLMLLASSYYPWNLKFQNDVPWCRSFLINCMEEVNGSFFSGGLFFSSGNFSCINNFITSKVNFLFDLTI